MTSPVSMEAAGGASGGRSKLEHAYLELHEPSPDGSLAKPGAKIAQIDFQFNPKELKLSKTAEWTRPTTKGNKKSAPPQFRGPKESSLTLELFFDASDTQDTSVVKRVELLFSCCTPTSASFAAKKPSPPWVLFRWGGLTGFLAYVGTVTANYTLFTPSGVPVRALCTVELKELAGKPSGQNPTSGALEPQRVHVMVEGDTLAGVAYREYGDPAAWRAVARANDIDDPLRVRPGMRLLLPVADALHPAAPVPTGGRIGVDA